MNEYVENDNRPPLKNNLATTLSIFPLAESRNDSILCKDIRLEELTDREMAELLFPNMDDMLFAKFLKMGIISQDEKLYEINKKRKKEENDELKQVKRIKEALSSYKSVREKRNIKVLETKLVKEYNKKHKENNKYIFNHSLIVKNKEKEYNYLPKNEFGVSMVHPYNLYKYQANSVKWLIERDDGNIKNEFFEENKSGSVFAMFMGLGKTLTIGTLVMRTLGKQRYEHSSTLYICPKGLLGTVYREFDKFFGDQVRCIVFHRDILRSNFKLFGKKEIAKYDVIITTYETVCSRVKYTGLFNKHIKGKHVMTKNKKFEFIKDFPKSSKIMTKSKKIEEKNAKEFSSFNWFRIILDESHEIREKTTKKYRGICSLTSQRRIAMTGTPICNSFSDLFSQMNFCGFKAPRGSRLTKNVFKDLGLMNMIRFVDYKEAKDQINIPPKTVHIINYTLSKREKMLHNHFLKSAQSIFTQSSSYSGVRKNNTTFQAMCGMIRVLQICSAPYLITSGAKEKYDSDDVQPVQSSDVFGDKETNEWIQNRDGLAGIGSSKNLKFINLMYQIGLTGEKIVVFANYTSTIKLAISAMCQKFKGFSKQHVFVHGGLKTNEREKHYTSFREGNTVKVLFMTLKVGSVGLNLTEACKLVYLEPWYSYTALQQGEARVHRIGQTKKVDIYYILGSETMEERVYNIADRKRKISEDLKSDHDKNLCSEDLRHILFSNMMVID